MRRENSAALEESIEVITVNAIVSAAKIYKQSTVFAIGMILLESQGVLEYFVFAIFYPNAWAEAILSPVEPFACVLCEMSHDDTFEEL